MADVSNNPLVSIIGRTKDRPKLLKRALQSIASQTYRPVEVVLVNDGGYDLEVEELKNILGDVFLNYIRLEKNMGRAHAGNVGIENAVGKYIGFLDDDDEFYPEHVETLVSFLEQSDYKVAYTDTEMVFQDFVPEEGKIVDVDKVIFSKDFSYTDLLIVNYIPFNSICFSKEVLNSVGSIDESFELYEDWDFLIRIGEKYPFYHIKNVTAIYNQWSKDLQINRANTDQMKIAHLRVIEKNLKKITPAMLLNLKQEKDEIELDLININGTIKAKDLYISQLGQSARERDSHISQLGQSVRERDSHISQLEQSVRERDSHISQLENIITVMRDTIGWKILENFRRLREKILPQGKIRRKIYDLVIKSYRVISEEDFHSFFARAKRKLRINKSRHHFTGSAQTLKSLKSISITEKREVDKNNFKVLFIVNHLDGGQRYRGFNMSEYLRLSGIESKVFLDNEIERWIDSIFEYDIMVLYRLFFTPLIRDLILKYREIGMPVIYDIDDYIFDVKALPLLNVRGVSKDELGQVIQKHRKVLDLCDCCIVPTERLAELSKELGKDTYVIRNGLSQELIDISESAYSKKPNKDNIVKIGYFSGTTTHDKDFLVAADSILRILKENENVFLCIGGHINIDERFDKFQERIELLPYVDWKLLPYNISIADINIVPLEVNVFNNSKSELKYFESALLRIPTVASPTESYTFAIRNGINGFIATSKEDWYRYLKILIEDMMLRQKMGEEAYKQALSYYSPEAMSNKILSIYHAVIDKYVMQRDRL